MTQPEPLTDQQLDEIAARAEAARPGPWILSDDLEGDGYPGHLWVVRTPDSGPDEPDDQAVVISIGDRALGEFIAHARTDVPALVAEVRRLRARRLTASEYDTAWHAVEGAAGEEGADPGTILHAVLDRLGIDWQDAARPAVPAVETGR